MADPVSFHFTLDPAARPPFGRMTEHVVPEIDWFNTNRASPRGGDPIRSICGMVIHATAGASASGAVSWWRAPQGTAASAHWIVPGESDAGHGAHVIACVYESLAAWHVRGDVAHPAIAAGRGGINRWTLGVEIVNAQDGRDGFSDWQITATAALARYAWAKYPNFRWVFAHAAVDPGRRSDPGTTFPWTRFEALVRGGTGLRVPAVATLGGSRGATGRPCCM